MMTAAPGPSGGRGLGTLINTTHARMQTSTPACPPTRLSARMHVRKRARAQTHARTLASARPILLHFARPILLHLAHELLYLPPTPASCSEPALASVHQCRNLVASAGVGRVCVCEYETHARAAHSCSTASRQQLPTKCMCPCARVCGFTSQRAGIN